MDDILFSADIGIGRTIHVGTLSRETISQSDADHLGFSGYFIFEACDMPGQKGISVLAKASSAETAMRLAEILQQERRELALPTAIAA